jgi:hypothetical protein
MELFLAAIEKGEDAFLLMTVMVIGIFVVLLVTVSR